MTAVQDMLVRANEQIARNTYRLDLVGDTDDSPRAGQFVNVLVPGFYLRRPFSLYQWGPGRLDLIYKVLGEGTAQLTQIRPGETLSVLTGLGNGFTAAAAARPLVVGGGVGVVPLLALVQLLQEAEQEPEVILGFRSADEVFLAEEMRRRGVRVRVTTEDGSAGRKGFVTAALEDVSERDYLYACGPTPMLRALAEAVSLPAQFSLEERMACGFGACVGCVVPTSAGPQRVCKEGPVFTREELQW